jgi:hypothetical protein
MKNIKLEAIVLPLFLYLLSLSNVYSQTVTISPKTDNNAICPGTTTT